VASGLLSGIIQLSVNSPEGALLCKHGEEVDTGRYSYARGDHPECHASSLLVVDSFRNAAEHGTFQSMTVSAA